MVALGADARGEGAENVVAGLEARLGDDHPALFQDLDWVARLQEELRRYDDAIATSERVLAASPIPNLSVARAHLRLGRIALERGNRADARTHLDAARPLYEDVVGTKDPGYQQVLDAQLRLDGAP